MLKKKQKKKEGRRMHMIPFKYNSDEDGSFGERRGIIRIQMMMMMLIISHVIRFESIQPRGN